jgi:hypothetical protein
MVSVTVLEGVRPERDTRRFDETGLSAVYAFLAGARRDPALT